MFTRTNFVKFSVLTHLLSWVLLDFCLQSADKSVPQSFLLFLVKLRQSILTKFTILTPSSWLGPAVSLISYLS